MLLVNTEGVIADAVMSGEGAAKGNFVLKVTVSSRIPYLSVSYERRLSSLHDLNTLALWMLAFIAVHEK